MESDVYDGKRVVLWKGDKLRVDVPLHICITKKIFDTRCPNCPLCFDNVVCLFKLLTLF